MEKSKFYISVLLMGLLSGCYTTAPTHWNSHHDRDVIKSKEVIPNGSRLNLSADVNGNVLDISATEIPLCRMAELGYEVIKESGARNPHSWPAGIISVGVLGVGAGLFIDGMSSMSKDGASDEEKAMSYGELIGGIVVSAIGAIYVGKCVLSDSCDPDTSMEYRYHDGGSFRRWEENADKRDCTGGIPKPASNVAINVSASWASTTEVATWKNAVDQDGKISMKIIGIIRNVGAHCGMATIKIVADTLDRPDFKDSPAAPSKRRDDSMGYKFEVKPAAAKAPDIYSDQTIRRIAETCAYKNTRACVGDSRATSIENKCKSECNTSNGAGYCEEQRQTELLMPDISEIERKEIDGRYDTCVKEHRIDNSSTNTCSSSCIDKAFSMLCPKPW